MSKAIIVTSEQPLEVKKEMSMQDALIAIVQRTDIDPDRLEKFLDLQIKMENRQSERAFNEAMAGFQGECPIIVKNKKTSFTSPSGKTTAYDYSPLDEIVAVIKPILQRFGFAFSFDVVEGPLKSKLVTKIKHRDGHTEISTLEFESMHDDARMNSSQRRKSALTYVKRAGLENALGLVTTGEDDDAHRAIDNDISQDQLSEIRELIKLTKTDEAKFSAAFQIAKLEDFSTYEAKNAIHALKEKRSLAMRPKKEANV